MYRIRKIGFLSRRFRSLPANMYVYITYYMHAVNASNILFIFEFHSLSFPVHVWKRLLGARKINNPPKYPIFSSCDRFCCSYLSFTLLSCDTLLLRPYDSSHTNQMFNYELHCSRSFKIRQFGDASEINIGKARRMSSLPSLISYLFSGCKESRFCCMLIVFTCSVNFNYRVTFCSNHR